MLMVIVKYVVTAGVVVLVSEVAKRSDRWGALIASLPLVTLLVMIWLKLEGQPIDKIANHAHFTFWYVLPTLPMFILMPWMLNHGIGFWWSLVTGCVLTFVCFGVTAALLHRFGIAMLF